MGIQQYAVYNKAQEQRLRHLQARSHQREEEQDGDGSAMRPQPAHVFAQILAALAARILRRLDGFRLAVLSHVVETAPAVVLNEGAVSLPR